MAPQGEGEDGGSADSGECVREDEVEQKQHEEADEDACERPAAAPVPS